MVERQGLCCSVQDDGLNGRRVEPGCQNGDRAENRIGLFLKPLENLLPFLLAVGVVQVHALVPLFDEHGLNLLGGVDAVVEDEGFGAFGFLFIGVKQFLLHEVIAVQSVPELLTV